MSAKPEPSLFRAEMGRRLAAARRRAGLSLGQVEKQSGRAWNATVIGSWERGDRSPTPERLAAYCAFLGVSVAEVWPGHEWPEVNPELIRGIEDVRDAASALLVTAEADVPLRGVA